MTNPNIPNDFHKAGLKELGTEHPAHPSFKMPVDDTAVAKGVRPEAPEEHNRNATLAFDKADAIKDNAVVARTVTDSLLKGRGQ